MDLRGEWRRYAQRDALVAELGGDAELAFGIFVGVGEEALAWLDLEVPALGGRTPRHCLATAEGRRLLRQVVARFPR